MRIKVLTENINYKNYKIQFTQSGCIVRNSKGEVVIKTPTEDEAKEYIDNNLVESFNVSDATQALRKKLSDMENGSSITWTPEGDADYSKVEWEEAGLGSVDSNYLYRNSYDKNWNVKSTKIPGTKYYVAYDKDDNDLGIFVSKREAINTVKSESELSESINNKTITKINEWVDFDGYEHSNFEDRAYYCYSYYDKAYTSLEDYFDTYNYTAAESFIWDKLQQGLYCIMETPDGNLKFNPDNVDYDSKVSSIEDYLVEGISDNIRKGDLKYDDEIDAYYDEDDDTYVQFQDRVTNQTSYSTKKDRWGNSTIDRKLDKHPRVSSNTWGRVWKNGKLDRQFEGPKYKVRQDVARYLDKNESYKSKRLKESEQKVTTYRNNKNPNKYIDIKHTKDRHYMAKPYMKWNTDRGEVKNYLGTSSKNGKYSRVTKSTRDSWMDDYTEVQSESLKSKGLKESYDMNSIINKFNDEYEFIYDNNDNVAGYKDAVYAFDVYMKIPEFNKLVKDFVSQRGDYLSSDRECGAFVLALDSLGILDNFDKYFTTDKDGYSVLK